MVGILQSTPRRRTHVFRVLFRRTLKPSETGQVSGAVFLRWCVGAPAHVGVALSFQFNAVFLSTLGNGQKYVKCIVCFWRVNDTAHTHLHHDNARDTHTVGFHSTFTMSSLRAITRTHTHIEQVRTKESDLWKRNCHSHTWVHTYTHTHIHH